MRNVSARRAPRERGGQLSRATAVRPVFERAAVCSARRSSTTDPDTEGTMGSKRLVMHVTALGWLIIAIVGPAASAHVTGGNRVNWQNA